MNEDIFNVDFFFVLFIMLQGHTCWYRVLLDFLNKRNVRQNLKRKMFFVHRSELTKNWSISSLTRLDWIMGRSLLRP